MTYRPTVHILLATYNGEQYLQEQLESIENQTYVNWTLTVSDDGSTDKTLDIIESFSKNVTQKIIVLRGPKLESSTTNFFHLINSAPIENAKDLYAFCDQDDVWHNDKLERAVAWHAHKCATATRLYCGRTEIVDKHLNFICYSPNFKNNPSFGNALVENIASGNTMVFDQAILLGLQKINPKHSVWHDWTTYLVTTGLGGIVFFDYESCLLYRQHDSNIIGQNNSISSVLHSLIPNVIGRFRRRLGTNQQALIDLYIFLSPTSKETFNNFITMRNSPSRIRKIIMFYKSAIKRQKIIANAAIIIALIFNFI
jgi:glycosyltransferase involved in cell wall biosynthesis